MRKTENSKTSGKLNVKLQKPGQKRLRENVGHGVNLYCKTSSKHSSSRQPAVVGFATPGNDPDLKREGFDKDENRKIYCLCRCYERFLQGSPLHHTNLGEFFERYVETVSMDDIRFQYLKKNSLQIFTKAS